MTGETEAGAPQAPGQGEALQVAWQGDPWSLAGLGLINFLLTVVTLGIYQFWGKTEVRRRIWSSVRLNGEPLEYTGTGKELLIGFLIVFFVLLLPVLLIFVGAQISLGEGHPVLVVLTIAVYVLFFFLFGVGYYRARRYRLSRTRWRGIRGALTGSSLAFGWGSFWSGLLLPFTAGWLAPWRSNYLYRWITNDMKFGDRPFRYNGQAGPLYLPFAVMWGGFLVAYFVILGLATGIALLNGVGEGGGEFDPEAGAGVMAFALGAGIGVGALLLYSVLSAWYYSRMLGHFTRHTTFEGLTFKLEVPVLGLIWLQISNVLITLLTLSILKPVAEARLARYIVERLQVSGTADFGAIAQSQARLGKTGEGLAEAFDIDAFG